MKKVYAEIKYGIDELIGFEERTQRILMPLDTLIEWFRGVIGDDEEIDVQEMLDDHILDFATHYLGETVSEVVEYYITDYQTLLQMDRDKRIDDLLDE